MNRLRFDDRVAIVTGAGRGLGRAYAKQLAERGARVVVNDLGGAMDGTLRDKAGASGLAEQVAAEIRRGGGTAVADSHSVAEAQGAAAIIELALDQFGRIDILINNAGIWQSQPFESYERAAFERDLAVHVWGPWNMTQAAWPHMKARGYGRVLNTISSAMFGLERTAGYCTVKAALVGFTRALATESPEAGIQVNAIEPSASSRLGAPLFTDEQRAWRDKYQSADMAAAGALWLVHEQCQANGGLYSCWSGRFAALFLAANEGQWTEPAEITPEWVAEHFAAATAPEKLFFPDHAGTYGGTLRQRMALPGAPPVDALRQAAKKV